VGVDLLAAAEALLPARPDLAAAVAAQGMDAAVAADDRDGWLAAAGVVLGARGRSGDGRRTAIDLLAAARRWGSTALTAPAARRLRVELALLAAGAGAAETVRALVAPVLATGTGGFDRALRPAARIALARSATDPVESTAALRAAREDCAEDRAGRIARVEVVLVGAAIARHDGAARTAVEFAEEGLRLLDGDIAVKDDDLRLSLVAESIAALLDLGDARRARERAEMGAALLRSTPGPRRQRALLQLTVVSAFAGVRDMAHTVAALAAAAQEAADSDAPELEAICRSALGAIHEKAGRLDAALAEFQAGVDAQHRDRDREQRFVAAVDAHIALEAPAAPMRPAPASPASRPAVAQPAVIKPPVATPPAAEPPAAEATAFDPQSDGISWFAGSAWGAESEARGADLTDATGSGTANPWSGGAWSNGSHRVAAGDRPAETSGGRNARREVRTSGHGTNGHDRAAARPSRHAKPDPSQLRARDTRDSRGDREPAPEADPLSPDWAGAEDDRVVDSDDVQSWMQTAMEELDRVWGPLPKRDTAATSGSAGATNSGSGTAPGHVGSNGHGDSTGHEASGRDRATDDGTVRGAAADRSDRRPAAARDTGEGAADQDRQGADRDAGRADVDGDALWPPFGHRSGPPTRRPAGNGSGSHRSVEADDDERTRRSALRAEAVSRRPIDTSADGEWPLGLSVREGAGARGSGGNAPGGSRRAPEGSAEDTTSTGRSRRGVAGERGSDASGQPADGAAEDAWPPLGRPARGRVDERGAGENASGGSRRAPDGPAEDVWPLGRSERGGTGDRGQGVSAPRESRQVPDSSAGAGWQPSGRPPRSRADEVAANGTGSEGSRQVADGSAGERRPLGRPVRGGAGERGSDGNSTGGTHQVPDGSGGERPPLGRPARTRADEGGPASGGSRPVPDGSAGDEWPLGRSASGDRRTAGAESADRQSRWVADEPADRESSTDGWSAIRRGSTDDLPEAEERSGRRNRAERDPYADPYGDLGVSESDPLFALLRAPKAPVSKDALADLARRLTVAPQRLSIAPDSATDGAAGDENGSARDASDGAHSETAGMGCTVVIDLARDGRRFAGIRAATVIREVAELVAEHVPGGSRVRFDEPDVLALVLPGWAGPDATRWMYRTLPGLLAGFTASEDIRGVQLRATVHDVDGPVGAQLLHRIDGGRGGAGGRHGADAEAESPRTARPAREAADRAIDRPAPRAADRPPPRPVERAAHRAADRPVRDDVAGATQDRVKPDTPAPAPTPAPFTEAEADGLGLADLLAGALAAYRSI